MNLFIFSSMNLGPSRLGSRLRLTCPQVWAVLRHGWSDRLSQASAHGLVFTSVRWPGGTVNNWMIWEDYLEISWSISETTSLNKTHLLKKISCHSTADILVMEEIGFYEIYWYTWWKRIWPVYENDLPISSNFTDEIPKSLWYFRSRSFNAFKAVKKKRLIRQRNTKMNTAPPLTYDISRVDAIQGGCSLNVLKLSQDSFRENCFIA